MTKEYPCPNCEDEVELDGNVTELTCKSCGQQIKVDYDAEFDNGMWHDMTKLYKT